MKKGTPKKKGEGEKKEERKMEGALIKKKWLKPNGGGLAMAG